MITTSFSDNILKVENVENFDTKMIFDCGQAFRFDPDGIWYTGVVGSKVIRVRNEGTTVYIENVTEDEFKCRFKGYFDLDLDYSKMIEKLSTDEHIINAMRYGYGIRILKQDLWETIVSFIISQNNNITRIKGIISRICSKTGKKIEYGGNTYYSFPTPEELSILSVADLKALGCGYRDNYIYEFTRSVLNGDFDINKLENMDTLEARKYLMSVKGIGGKVADCILLFGLHRYEAFPHDV